MLRSEFARKNLIFNNSLVANLDLVIDKFKEIVEYKSAHFKEKLYKGKNITQNMRKKLMIKVKYDVSVVNKIDTMPLNALLKIKLKN